MGTGGITLKLPILDMGRMGGYGDGYGEGEVVRACMERGVFYVVNHGVREDVIAQMEEEGKRLFSLPMGVKKGGERGPGSLFGYGKPLVGDPLHNPLWSECFTFDPSVFRDLDHDHDHDHGHGLHHLVNRRPFREYKEALHGLALRLFYLLSNTLGMDIKKLDSIIRGGGMGYVHLNHYPPCPDPSKTMGIPPHTDSSLLTIIHQRTRGLQIFQDNNLWIDVPPLERSFVIQLGDMFQLVSNDRYKSVVHRAVVSKDAWRLSIAYFLAPPPLEKMKPCVTLKGGETPMYRDVTWQEVVATKRKQPVGALNRFHLANKAMDGRWEV